MGGSMMMNGGVCMAGSVMMNEEAMGFGVGIVFWGHLWCLFRSAVLVLCLF
jgi:hypothetical protein